METETETKTEPEIGTEIILYDGVCGLCNRFVKTVIDRDPDGHFQFASLQSELAASILTSIGRDPTVLKSIFLISGYGTDHMTVKSKAAAAIAIFGKLRGPLSFLKYLAFLPSPLLNLGYDCVAAIRYKVFGRHDTCPLPDPKHLKRFLDQN